MNFVKGPHKLKAQVSVWQCSLEPSVNFRLLEWLLQPGTAQPGKVGGEEGLTAMKDEANCSSGLSQLAAGQITGFTPHITVRLSNLPSSVGSSVVAAVTHPEGPQEHKPLWSTLQCGQGTAPPLPGWQHLGPSGVSLVFPLLSLHHFAFSSFPEHRKRRSQEVNWSNCLLCNSSDFCCLPGFLLYTK